MSDNHGSPRKSSFGQSMKAVFWSFFGVRKRRDLEADATQLNPLHVLAAALISVALKRLDGESASIREGFEAALSNLPAIVGYAMIAATVGTILRAVEERVGLVGRIVVAIIGAGWTLATAMTLPVLVEENVGPVEAISRSLDLLKSNWGENLIGNGGISLGVAVVAIPVMVIAVLVMFAAMATKAVATMVLGMLFFALAVMRIMADRLRKVNTRVASTSSRKASQESFSTSSGQ